MLDSPAWTSPTQGSEKLREIHRLTDASGAVLRVARMKPNIRRVLAADGVLDAIGDDRFHGNVDAAVEAQLSQPAGRA